MTSGLPGPLRATSITGTAHNGPSPALLPARPTSSTSVRRFGRQAASVPGSVAARTTSTLRCSYGMAPGGRASILLFFDGVAWSVDSAITENINLITGSARDDVWVRTEQT